LTQVEFVDNASEYILGWEAVIDVGVKSSKSFDVMRSATDTRVGSSSDEGTDWKVIGDKGETGDLSAVYPEAVGVTTVELEC